jgi:hypothetical protein
MNAEIMAEQKRLAAEARAKKLVHSISRRFLKKDAEWAAAKLMHATSRKFPDEIAIMQTFNREVE